MKGIAKFGLTTAALAALTIPAFADYDDPHGVSVRAGIYYATGAAKAAEGQNWFTIGVDYKLGSLGYSSDGYNANYSLSVDYYGKGSYSNMPILLNYTGRTDGFYYTAGAGLAFVHMPGNSDMEFGYQFAIGKDFDLGKQPVFLEVRYFGTSQDELNGFSISAGIRF